MSISQEMKEHNNGPGSLTSTPARDHFPERKRIGSREKNGKGGDLIGSSKKGRWEERGEK